MPSSRDESELIAAAQPVIGDAETVLSAGVFGPADAQKAIVHGQTVGALVGGPVGVLVGSMAGRERYSDEHGITMKLIVAVTATKIYVVTWPENGTPSRIHETFDRATTTVHTKHFGLSLTLTLEDEAAGTNIKLSGSVARIAAQSGPDKDVLAELARTA